MRVLNERYADGDVDLTDGIKIFDDRGWVQVLPDADEPLDPPLRRGRAPPSPRRSSRASSATLVTDVIEREEIGGPRD